MRKWAILLIALLLCAVAFAAIDSEVKRRASIGELPAADGTIDAFDRGVICGVYLPTLVDSTGSNTWILHHH